MKKGNIHYVQSLAGAVVVAVVWSGAVFLALAGMLTETTATPTAAPMIFFGLGVFFGMQVYRLTLKSQPWLWPLPVAGRYVREQLLGHEYDGSFGFKRKHEVHTGVDVYCSAGQEVRAVADGRVLLVTDFTGEKAGSPWWYPTQAVLVEHDGRVVVYGELEPLVRNDDAVRRGQVLGRVLRVRKTNAEQGITGTGDVIVENDKPTTMLHLELWDSVENVISRYTGTNSTVANDWPLDGKRPKGLLDPTSWLKDAEDS